MNATLTLEKEILGEMIQDVECLNYGTFELTENDFSHKTNQRIFLSIKDQQQKNGVVNFITLCESFKDKPTIIGYLSEIIAVNPWIILFKVKVRDLQGRSSIGRLKGILERLKGFVESHQDDANQCLEYATKEILGLESASNDIKVLQSNEICDEISRKVESAVDMSGIPTGFRDLDDILGGFRPGNLVIVAARVSVGKSVFGIQVAKSFEDQGLPVALVTLEMSAEEMFKRILANEANINLHRINTNDLASEDREIILHTLKSLRESKIITVDAISLSEIRLRVLARQLKAKYNIHGLIVDYLQLMHSDDDNEDTVKMLGNVSRSLKSISKELSIPVIALAQLNRRAMDVEEPQLHHLRASGNLEQDADVVILMHRLEATPEQQKAFEWPTRFNVAKNRNGATRSFDMRLEGKYCRFVRNLILT